MGSEFYRRCLKWHEDNSKPKYGVLFIKTWGDTQWMLDAFTGRDNGARYHAICEWCHGKLGPEARPIHGNPGNWHIGSTTIYGRTWLGFATEAMMLEFQAAWPDPEEVDRELRG